MTDDSRFKAPIVIISVDSGTGPVIVHNPTPIAIIVDATASPPVTPSPVVDFTASPRVGFEPLTVEFTDLTQNSPIAWEWDFTNDGTVDSTLQNPTFVYPTPGTYSVKLTATNAYGTASEVKIDYIVVNPVTDFVGDQTTIDTIVGFGLNVFTTNVVTDSPTNGIFGVNVLAADVVIPEPVYYNSGPNAFFTGNITTFPINLLQP